MKSDLDTTRAAQDKFQSMVGETGPVPNDPQHPDPGFDVDTSPGDADKNEEPQE